MLSVHSGLSFSLVVRNGDVTSVTSQSHEANSEFSAANGVLCFVYIMITTNDYLLYFLNARLFVNFVIPLVIKVK